MKNDEKMLTMKEKMQMAYGLGFQCGAYTKQCGDYDTEDSHKEMCNYMKRYGFNNVYDPYPGFMLDNKGGAINKDLEHEWKVGFKNGFEYTEREDPDDFDLVKW